jgi:hypothetical protein
MLFQLALVYNADLVTTIAELRAHLPKLGRDVPPSAAPIADDDINLSQQMVTVAHQALINP